MDASEAEKSSLGCFYSASVEIEKGRRFQLVSGSRNCVACQRIQVQTRLQTAQQSDTILNLEYLSFTHDGNMPRKFEALVGDEYTSHEMMLKAMDAKINIETTSSQDGEDVEDHSPDEKPKVTLPDWKKVQKVWKAQAKKKKAETEKEGQVLPENVGTPEKQTDNDNVKDEL